MVDKTERMSVQQYRALTGGVAAKLRPMGASKYSAQATVVDGERFDSKLEARRFAQLKLLKAAGEVLYWLRQVPFQIGFDTRYRVDFQIFWANGDVTYEDTKGILTGESRTKIRTVEAQYPVRIQILTKNEVGK